MITATWNGKVIAESDSTVVVEGNHYFPPESIKDEYFKSSDHETSCGWKGVASYRSIVVDGQTNENAAWFYASPKSAASNIKGCYAFWKGVQVDGESGPDQAPEDAVCDASQ